MPITHKNRRGDLYYLHAGVTKTGKPRYWFARKAEGELVEEVPPGFEVFEDLNGIVSLRKPERILIDDAEVQIVRTALVKYPRLRDYRVETRATSIIIYKAYNPLDERFLQDLTGIVGVARLDPTGFREMQLRSLRYDPVLRFTLEDRTKRTFGVDRMYYSGEGGWLPLDSGGTLVDLAREYVPHLGRDSFYELI